MALKSILSTSPGVPYPDHPYLHIHVLLMIDQPRVLSWRFVENTAVPVVSDRNKVAVITDGESITKINLFEELGQKMSQGKNYVIWGYTLGGRSPPYHMRVQKTTLFYRSYPVVCRDGLMEEARALLYPPSLHTKINEIPVAKGLLTLEGEITALTTLKRVSTRSGEVPLREVTLQGGDASVSIKLWRQAAVVKLELGTPYRVTHLRPGLGWKEWCLQSTEFSRIESC
ncbi:uncharacterized protein LOC110368340 isoform X2 [Fundulus heteroclitus]|nr:uncharacterized protein LOC110368340 isoform X2 [Fundulus heteroclitus]